MIRTSLGNKNFWKRTFAAIVKVYFSSVILVLIVVVGIIILDVGYLYGYKKARKETTNYYGSIIEGLLSGQIQTDEEPAVIITKEVVVTPPPTQKSSLLREVNWGGPELWEAVNKKRAEYGVNPLSQSDTLCTVASVRLNEQLELGKLDGHEGFNELEERRPDLDASVKEGFSTVAEFLLAGAETAEEAVSLWENTLSHKKLLTAGEYVWGCIYAQNSFAVALAAF